MLACLDVDYRDNDEAMAAAVVLPSWTAAAAAEQHVERVTGVQAYQPGSFYLRELPCLLAVLGKVRAQLSGVIVDGYVWLGQERRPGLGHHLHEALGRRIPVIGVAKTQFRDTPAAEVLRGGSARPLFVTTAGMDLTEAADHVRSMHGPHRIPTLIKAVDVLCRWA